MTMSADERARRKYRDRAAAGVIDGNLDSPDRREAARSGTARTIFDGWENEWVYVEAGVNFAEVGLLVRSYFDEVGRAIFELDRVRRKDNEDDGGPTYLIGPTDGVRVPSTGVLVAQRAVDRYGKTWKEPPAPSRPKIDPPSTGGLRTIVDGWTGHEVYVEAGPNYAEVGTIVEVYADEIGRGIVVLDKARRKADENHAGPSWLVGPFDGIRIPTTAITFVQLTENRWPAKR